MAAGLAAALPTPAWACGPPSAAADGADDRSWVDSNAVLYGASADQGVFRLRLNSNRLEAVGTSAAQRVNDLRFSASKRWLLYWIHGRGWFLFDTFAGAERRLDDLVPASTGYVLAPVEDKLAGAAGDGESVVVIDLKTDTAELYSLATLPPESGAVISVIAWLDTADRVVLQRRAAAALPRYWSLDLGSGRLALLDARYDQATQTNHYFEGGVALGSYRPLWGGQKTFSDPPLADGARVSNSREGGLVVTRANGETTVLVAGIPRPPPNEPMLACGPRPAALLGAFDGRYVFYRDEVGYWIYGLREGRKALLVTNRVGVNLVW